MYALEAPFRPRTIASVTATCALAIGLSTLSGCSATDACRRVTCYSLNANGHAGICIAGPATPCVDTQGVCTTYTCTIARDTGPMPFDAGVDR